MPSATLLPGVTEMPTIPGSPLYEDILSSSDFLTGESTTSSPFGFEPSFVGMTGTFADSSMFNATGIENNWELETTTAYRFIEPDPNHIIVPTLMPNFLQDPMLDLLMTIDPSPPLINPAMDTQFDLPTVPTEPALDHRCSCLSRAFGLLQQLSCISSRGVMFDFTSDQPEQFTSGHVEETCQGIRAKKDYLEDVINMVECTCSEDPHLLSLKSLLAFKVMGLYKITSPGSTEDSPAHQCYLR